MNLKKNNDLFTVIAAAVLLCAMLPLVLSAIEDDAVRAVERWRSIMYAEPGAQDEYPMPSEPAETGTSAAEPSETGTSAAEPSETAPPAAETTATETTTTTTTSSASEATTAASTLPTVPQLMLVHAEKSYFDDALFIGDSRTEDLGAYGTLDNADYYARVGMSVYNLDDKAVDVKGVGKVKLDELLAKRDYRKVYIMLGFNEIYYNHNSVIKKYSELIDRVRKAEPDAIIYLEANLLVSEKQSREGGEADNKSLNELNGRIALLADNESVFYIDVNPLFCKNGALDDELSGDGVHPYAKYYKVWSDWLCDNTVIGN